MRATIKIKPETYKLLKEKKGSMSYSEYIEELVKRSEINEQIKEIKAQLLLLRQTISKKRWS